MTSSYIYGGMEQYSANINEGTVLHFLKGLFPKYRNMVAMYPSLEKHPWLYPAYFVVRWIDVIFIKNNAGEKLARWSARDKLKKEKQPQTKKMMEELGLW